MTQRIAWKFVALLAVAGLSLAACQSRTPTSAPPPTVALTTPEAVPPELYLLFQANRDSQLGWYIMRPDGSDVQKLTFPKLSDRQVKGLTWVPALKVLVANLADSQFLEDYFLIDMQGNILHRLTADGYGGSDAQYSSRAGKFVFACVASDLDICVISPDGTNYANLTLYPSRESSPSWSPSGGHILYVSNRNAVPGIWVMKSDGSEPTNLSGAVQSPEANPSWSPDGKKILFESQRDQNWEVYVMDADGRNVRNLTQHSAADDQPVWSPDGSHIAFRSKRDGEYDIFVMRADGSGLKNVTRTPDYAEVSFIWSVDSQYIVYRAVGEAGKLDLFAVNRDGTGRVNLTNSPWDEADPQWIGH